MDDVWSFAIFLLSVSIVIVTIYIFAVDKRKQNSEAAEALRIIRDEVQEHKTTLGTDSEHERIAYAASGENDRITYVNAYLETDGYDSLVQSGLIKHLRIDIQTMLTMLYARIRIRNEFLTYMTHYEDLFFLTHDSSARLKAWYKKIEKYDVLVTSWERDIVKRLDKVQEQLEKEKPLSHRYFRFRFTFS